MNMAKLREMYVDFLEDRGRPPRRLAIGRRQFNELMANEYLTATYTALNVNDMIAQNRFELMGMRVRVMLYGTGVMVY